jgi:hypothetical protein
MRRKPSAKVVSVFNILIADLDRTVGPDQFVPSSAADGCSHRRSDDGQRILKACRRTWN